MRVSTDAPCVSREHTRPMASTRSSRLAAWDSPDTPARAHATAAKGRVLPSCPARSAEAWGRSAPRSEGAEVGDRVSDSPPNRRWPGPPADVAWRLPCRGEVILDKEHANETPPSLPSPCVPHDHGLLSPPPFSHEAPTPDLLSSPSRGKGHPSVFFPITLRPLRCR